MLVLDQRFSFQDQPIAWGSLGEGNPVILVHGFPWSAQAWRNIAPWIARTHKVYVFDMLGTGQSEKGAAQNVSETVQSDLLAALITHWGLARPQIVGHDFGGLAVLRSHFVNGIDYAQMHLINAVATLPSGSPFYAHVAEYEAAFAGLPGYAHEALFRAYIGAASHYPLREETIRMYFEPWSGAEGKPAFYRQIAQANPDNIREAEALYRRPDFDVHISWGVHDTFIPLQQGLELNNLIGAKTFTRLDSAAHIVQEDAPQDVLGTILQHI